MHAIIGNHWSGRKLDWFMSVIFFREAFGSWALAPSLKQQPLAPLQRWVEWLEGARDGTGPSEAIKNEFCRIPRPRGTYLSGYVLSPNTPRAPALSPRKSPKQMEGIENPSKDNEKRMGMCTHVVASANVESRRSDCQPGSSNLTRHLGSGPFHVYAHVGEYP
jgi:hypothetical protein